MHRILSARSRLLCGSLARIIGLLIVGAILQVDCRTSRGDIFEGPGVFPREILEARGFLAEDHHIITPDRHKIRLTRARNPLINGGRFGANHRIPILFIHGILESFNVFVTNSFDVKPKDFSKASLAHLGLAEAEKRYADEPSAKSLPLLALNHGHEIWLMSRRGFPGSRTMLGNPKSGNIGERSRTSGRFKAMLGGFTELGDLSQYPFSFDKNFWNYSLDEQAKFDVPLAVDLVLNKTGRKQVSVVGHSAGGALTLMALSMFPSLNQKIQNAIFWSEAFSLGHGDIFNLMAPYKPVLKKFVGALPPTYLTEPFLGLGGVVCSLPLIKRSLCENVADLVLGRSHGEAPLKPEFLNSLLYSSSSHEVDQLLQCAIKRGPMHKFNYGRDGNRVAYGQEKPPAYNLSAIALGRMSFYKAATDFTVSPADVAYTERLLPTQHRSKMVRAPFNHNGYFFHKDAARLVIIPSLRDIHEFSERGSLM